MSKDFLYIENNKVKASKAILQVPAFRRFYAKTINDTKTLGEKAIQKWNDYITYVYFVYKLSSQFGNDDYSYLNNKPQDEREFITIENELEGRYDLKTLRKDKDLQSLIDDYNNFCKPSTELLLESLGRDMDDHIRTLSTIPQWVKEKIQYTIPDEALQPGMPAQVTAIINIPNTKAKSEAYKAVESILAIKEKYNKIVFKEKQTQQKGQSKKHQFEDDTLSFNLSDLNEYGTLVDVDISSIQSMYGTAAVPGSEPEAV